MFQPYNRILVWVTALLLVTGVGFTVYRLYFGSKIAINRIIAEHVKDLAKALEEIDATCGVIGIARNHTPIDFLTVRSFSGSEVGALQLAHPERWKGPYVERNLTIEGILYELVKTKEGWYVVPGVGVKLANGKVIGKDIVFTPDTDVDSFVNDAGGLEYNGTPMALHIHFAESSRPDFIPTLQTDSAGLDEA